ncbi:hypothetical protein [Sinorhizobium meliloti]|uniref:hypothetical protein n=1 Tax=Rhizobium meliloti TaxID=382 RepID=UPI00107213E4|nr:hypothetical protein [Sinorhizobium meliloti]MQW31063.1 hypothetical protein [Sinorhizobium meliloti]MQW60877.1 hypothetical protein [Sinorhizobium meliloti]MQX93255.1 hypothetical protein [Sinorhizobium meliloti]
MTVIYEAIPVEGVTALNSQLSGVKWSDGTLFLDFTITDKPMIARATIKDCDIFRVLSESYVPESETEEQTGLSEEHLVYSVEGSFFYKHHVPAIFGLSSTHYRFVTGPRLIDVLARTPPVMRTLGVSK